MDVLEGRAQDRLDGLLDHLRRTEEEDRGGKQDQGEEEEDQLGAQAGAENAPFAVHDQAHEVADQHAGEAQGQNDQGQGERGQQDLVDVQFRARPGHPLEQGVQAPDGAHECEHRRHPPGSSTTGRHQGSREISFEMVSEVGKTHRK